MESQEKCTKPNCCFACLATSEETTLHCYNVQNDALKAIFLAERICLCYLCKRVAEKSELFIQNVQSNQILLENFCNVNTTTFQKVRSQTQPLTHLVHFPLESIDSTDSDGTYKVYDSNPKVKIELEYKDESELLEDLDGHFDDGTVDNDLEAHVKEEDEYPLKLLKQELEMEGIRIKCLRKTPKNKKLKKKGIKQEKKVKKELLSDDISSKIEMIYITSEQCMLEREEMALEEKYLNSEYKCIDCLKGFNYKSSYEKHRENHMACSGDYECDVCRQRFVSSDKLIQHKRYHEVRYRCVECGLTRVTRVSIKEHYRMHHAKGRYQYACPHCSKVFYRQVSLRKHIGYTHRGRSRVQCAYCLKTYATKEVLKKHMAMRHPKEVSAKILERKHICSECGMAFRAPSQLKAHGIKHSHRRDYYCVECDKSFKSEAILKNHLKTAMPHVSFLELPLACERCDKRFAMRRDLERHMNRIHLNIKPYQCDRCEKAYINSWSLVQHTRLTHEGYKRPLRFPCTMCDKIFDRNQTLKAHIRTHTGERPFQCSKCPAQFSQRSVLGTHFKLIHLKLTRDGRPKGMPTIALK